MQFEEMLLTGRVVGMALVGCFAVGLPAVVFGASLCRSKPSAADLWFHAPLVGAGLAVLFCQNLLYADVRISASAPLLWALAGGGWVWLLASAGRRRLLCPVPWTALGLGAGVYLVHASGLLSLGASNYYGYGWGDMFNYVSMAQFFVDVPFHSDAANQGYLYAAQFYKTDRIGQSVLHAFLMWSSGADAQQSFGSTIILSPYLMFFGFLTLARHFLPLSPTSYVAALAGALCPTIATVHLECFLSQAVCMPFLLLLPAAIGYVVDLPGWRSALLAGLLMAVISAIYTEFLPIVWMIAIICGVAKCATSLAIFRSGMSTDPAAAAPRTPLVSLMLWGLLAVIMGLCFNPGYLHSALGIFSRTTTGAVLVGLFPWAFKAEGVVRLWVGNQARTPAETIFEILFGASIVVFVCNMVSLTRYAKRSCSVFFITFVLLLFVPAGPLVMGGGGKYPYQFYKLLLTIAPLHAFWFAIGVALLGASSIKSRNVAFAVSVLLAVVNGALTLGITRASANPETVASTHRGGAHLLIDPDFSQLRNFLGRTKDRDVLTLWYDSELYTGAYRTAWINYFARHNRVRSLINTASGQEEIAAESIDVRFSDEKLRQISSAIVVSWRPLDGLKGETLISNPLVVVYETDRQADMRRLVDASRTTLSRNLELRATLPYDPATFYPVWVSGKTNNYSLLTMKFGEFNEFRYDHWGYPAVYLRPQGKCSGNNMSLTVLMMQLDKRIRIECNGAVAEAELPLSFTSLERSGLARFGWNAGIGSLEGKYPLAESFPGSIRETP